MVTQGGTNPAKSEGRQFSARDVLAMIFRRKWVILAIFLATLAMGVSASLKSTSEFQATAKVLIRRSEGSSFQRQKSPYLGLEEEMNTEIEILRSDPVMDRAVEYVESEIAPLGAAERAELFPPEDEGEEYHMPSGGWLNKNLQAEPVEQSNVIQIRFRHENPATARMLADAVANAYVVERIAVRRNPMLESFFQDRTTGLKDRLLDLRTELGQLQIESGVYDEEWQKKLNLGTLDDIRTELLRVRVKRETEERKLHGIERRLAQDPELVLPILEFEDDRAFQELRVKLIDKRTILAELRGKYLPEHPKIQQTEAFIALLEEDLRREIQTQIKAREGEIESLRAQEGALETAVQDLSEEMKRIPRYAPMLRQIEREISNTSDLYELVGTKMVDTQISETEDQRMVNAKVLSPATVRVSFVQQRKSLFALFAAMLGLSLGLALAFLLEGLDQTLRTPDDVELNLGVPLLGSIPELKPAARR
ncbi:MAG: Wzz/FepE/Etk N-terminal domain-containing protein [bacterium]